jgi:hypothetical protein
LADKTQLLDATLLLFSYLLSSDRREKIEEEIRSKMTDEYSPPKAQRLRAHLWIGAISVIETRI